MVGAGGAVHRDRRSDLHEDEEMSDDLREAPGSYEARHVVPAATGARPATRAARRGWRLTLREEARTNCARREQRERFALDERPDEAR